MIKLNDPRDEEFGFTKFEGKLYVGKKHWAPDWPKLHKATATVTIDKDNPWKYKHPSDTQIVLETDKLDAYLINPTVTLDGCYCHITLMTRKEKEIHITIETPMTNGQEVIVRFQAQRISKLVFFDDLNGLAHFGFRIGEKMIAIRFFPEFRFEQFMVILISMCYKQNKKELQINNIEYEDFLNYLKSKLLDKKTNGCYFDAHLNDSTIAEKVALISMRYANRKTILRARRIEFGWGPMFPKLTHAHMANGMWPIIVNDAHFAHRLGWPNEPDSIPITTKCSYEKYITISLARKKDETKTTNSALESLNNDWNLLFEINQHTNPNKSIYYSFCICIWPRQKHIKYWSLPLAFEVKWSMGDKKKATNVIHLQRNFNQFDFTVGCPMIMESESEDKLFHAGNPFIRFRAELIDKIEKGYTKWPSSATLNGTDLVNIVFSNGEMIQYSKSILKKYSKFACKLLEEHNDKKLTPMIQMFEFKYEHVALVLDIIQHRSCHLTLADGTVRNVLAVAKKLECQYVTTFIDIGLAHGTNDPDERFDRTELMLLSKEFDLPAVNERLSFMDSLWPTHII